MLQSTSVVRGREDAVVAGECLRRGGGGTVIMHSPSIMWHALFSCTTRSPVISCGSSLSSSTISEWSDDTCKSLTPSARATERRLTLVSPFSPSSRNRICNAPANEAAYKRRVTLTRGFTAILCVGHIDGRATSKPCRERRTSGTSSPSIDGVEQRRTKRAERRCVSRGGHRHSIRRHHTS